MKKYTEILEEIKTARECITDTARAEKEIERAAFKMDLLKKSKKHVPHSMQLANV